MTRSGIELESQILIDCGDSLAPNGTQGERLTMKAGNDRRLFGRRQRLINFIGVLANRIWRSSRELNG